MGNTSVVATNNNAPIIAVNNSEIKDKPSDNKFNNLKGDEQIFQSLKSDNSTKEVANQISNKIITLPDSSINEEDMTTERLAPFIKEDFERKQQDLYLKGSSEDTYVVNKASNLSLSKSSSHSISSDLGYEDINQKLPYTISLDGKIVSKPSDETAREKPVSPLPYVKANHFVSDADLKKAIKEDGSLLDKSYWIKKESYETFVEGTGDLVGNGAAIVGGVGATYIAGPVAGVIAAGAGEVAGERVGEDYIAPAIHHLGLTDQERLEKEYKGKMKKVYQARFGDKWESIDVKETMALLPPGPAREAFYEAFADRPRVQKYYSPQQRENLAVTNDFTGEKAYLKPGADPSKRPVSLQVLGEAEPAVIVGFNQDIFANNRFSKFLTKNSEKLNLSPEQIKNAKGLMGELRNSKMPVLARGELYVNPATGSTSIILYVRPNNISALIKNPVLGKEVKEQMKKLPDNLKNLNSPELRPKTRAGKLNTYIRVSVPIASGKSHLKASIEEGRFVGEPTDVQKAKLEAEGKEDVGSLAGSIQESLKGLNVGIFVEKDLLTGGEKRKNARKFMNQYMGVDTHWAYLIRTIPENSLSKVPEGTTYFSGVVVYAANDPQSSDDKKSSKATKLGKTISNFAKHPIKNSAKFAASALSGVGENGLYLGAGVYFPVASINPANKVINDEGHEVYTVNVPIPDWMPNNDDPKNDYLILGEGISEVIDYLHPVSD